MPVSCTELNSASFHFQGNTKESGVEIQRK